MRGQLGAVKRLLELMQALPEVRQQLQHSPQAVLDEWNLKLDPHQVEALWNPTLQGQPVSPCLQAWGRHREGRARARQQLRQDCLPQPLEMRLWRDRQERRCLSQLGQQRWEVVLHYPAALELCQGCSVGCWFCGFAAPRLSASWPATPENTRLWRQILDILRARVGPAARRSFCYWATDPLDNPDYEQFCQIFYQSLGAWPRTTTALATRQSERTRALLAMSAAHGGEWDRLSILSLSQLRKLYQNFTPKELLDVELVIHCDEELVRSTAGRARLAVEKGQPQTRNFPAQTELAGTIACVSGFLVNLVQAKVQLISPCTASQTYPLGYRVFGEEHFDDAATFDASLQALTRPELLEIVPANQRLLRWRSDLSWQDSRLVSAHLVHAFQAGCAPLAWLRQSDGDPPPFLLEQSLQGELPQGLATLSQRLSGDGTTLGEAMLALSIACDQPPPVTRARLLGLWQAGLLDDSAL